MPAWLVTVRDHRMGSGYFWVLTHLNCDMPCEGLGACTECNEVQATHALLYKLV